MNSAEKSVVGVFLLIFLCIFGYCFGINYVDNKSIENLVARGVHPTDAYCAIRGARDNTACIVRQIATARAAN